ncbi:hypothetical protein [Cryptosporangium aurantiacum]|nr:hypothetical protein [Cryptosporangium aurantiacum]
MTLLIGRRRAPKYDPIAEAEATAAAARIAESRAAAARAEVERMTAEAAARPLIAEAEREAARLTAAAEAEAAERNRAAVERDRQYAKAEREIRAEKRAETLRQIGPVVPLLVVNGAAMFGQISAYLGLAGENVNIVAALALAALVASAAEVISVYVQWHSHDALLRKDGLTAAKLRRASYLIALVIGGVNYSHFSDGWQPTTAAVVIGLCSVVSPWLWGLHTRRAQHVQLVAEGRADTPGALFGIERRRAFPIRTWKARRWSIDNWVTDPRDAWDGFKAEYAGVVAERAERKAAGKNTKAGAPSPRAIVSEPAGELAESTTGPSGDPYIDDPAAVVVLEPTTDVDLYRDEPTAAEYDALEPTADDERAWDAREDDAYGHTLSDPEPAAEIAPLSEAERAALAAETALQAWHATHDGTPRMDCPLCPDPEPERSAELAELSKADVVLIAVRSLGGDPASESAKAYASRAVTWAADRGVVITRTYVYDALRRHRARLTAAGDRTEPNNVVALPTSRKATTSKPTSAEPWPLDCTVCGESYGPFATEDEALSAAGLHDSETHNGQPTAAVPFGPIAASRQR